MKPVLVFLLMSGSFAFCQKIIEVNNTDELLVAKKNIRGGSESVIIELSDGVYWLNSTLVFDVFDGRSGDNTVTYKAAENADPVLSGGYLVKGNWERIKDKGYFKIKLPKSAPLEKIKYVRNIYVNGKRGIRARSKKISINGVYKNNNGDYEGIYIDSLRIGPIKEISTTELNQLVRWKDHYYKIENQKLLNGNYYFKIKNYDWVHTQSFSFAPSHYMPFSNYERGVLSDWYLVNALELLDRPGEWFYDSKTTTLYYYPREDENLKNARVILPILNKLISIKSAGLKKVKNLIFDGITFSHTNWDFPSKEGFFTLQGSIISNGINSMGADNNLLPTNKTHIDAAFQVDGCENLILRKNVFSHIGSNALNIHNNATKIYILSNTFSDISSNAIRIGNVFNQKIDPKAGEGKVSEVHIENNYISSIGKEFKGSIGIEFMYANGVKVKHNEIFNVPYIGISAGIGWEGIWSDNSTTMADSEISYNKIVGAMSVAKEGGSIYTNNRHNNIKNKFGLVIRENYIDEVTLPPKSYKQAPIHHDEGSDNILVKKNYIETSRPHFVWAHKSCSIKVDSTFVSPLKATNVIGKSRRCTIDFNVTNTLSPYHPEAQTVRINAGVQKKFRPPKYPY
ncbi:MAG: right-handed parallel beta-helix repeat-containing protein [Jejuia sp.]